MRKIDCFFRGIVRSIRKLKFMDGHSYKEVYCSDELQVLRCKYCGHESNGWTNIEE